MCGPQILHRKGSSAVDSSQESLKGHKRILYVFNASWFFLSHRRPFARAAKDAGYEVHVAAAPLPGDAEIIEADGMTFHPLPLARRGMNPFIEFKTILSIFRLYSKLKPDLIEQATIKPVIYGSLVSKFISNLSIVNWMTGLGYVFITDSVRGSSIRILVVTLYRFVFKRKCFRVIFENPDDQNQFIDKKIIDRKQSIVIRGAGVDTKLFVPSSELTGCVVIVLPARMLWDKGVGEFVEAARTLKSEGIDNTRFILVGDIDDGNPASVSRAQLKEWENDGVIEWWGRRNDMAAVFAQAHIVCLPSYREGLPKVLLEAAASGRPIATTDVPGCREVVREGSNGLLVPVKDSDALAAALRKLIENKELREQMGAKGREIVLNEFSEEKIVAETVAVYKELLGQ